MKYIDKDVYKTKPSKLEKLKQSLSIVPTDDKFINFTNNKNSSNSSDTINVVNERRTKQEVLRLLRREVLTNNKQVSQDFRKAWENNILGPKPTNKEWYECIRQASFEYDEIYERFRYWHLDQVDKDLRKQLTRSLSCGDTLDEENNKMLLKKLKASKKNKAFSLEQIEKELHRIANL